MIKILSFTLVLTISQLNTVGLQLTTIKLGHA